MKKRSTPALHDYFAAASREPQMMPTERVDRLIALGSRPLGYRYEQPPRGWYLPQSFIIAALLALAVLPTILLLPSLRHGVLHETEWSFDSDELRTFIAEHRSDSDPRGADVTYFSGCPLDRDWNYDVSRKTIAPASIATTPPLELNDLELARLGVYRGMEGEIEVIANNDPPYTEYPLDLRFSRSEAFETHTPRAADRTAGPAPRLVTDPDGRRRFFHFNYNQVDAELNRTIGLIYTWTWEKWGELAQDPNRQEEYERLVKQTGVDSLKEKMDRKAEAALQADRMIPVLVRGRGSEASGEAASGECSPWIILWYPDRPEVTRLLPADWQERMKLMNEKRGEPLKLSVGENMSGSDQHEVQQPEPEELDGSKLKSRGEDRIEDMIPEHPGNDRPTGSNRQGEKNPEQKLLEEGMDQPGPGVRQKWLEEKGDLPIDVGFHIPPTESDGRIDLRLKNSRTIAISLHRLDGTRIGMLIDDRPLSEGTYSLRLDMSRYGPGLYMAVVTTDRHEMIIRRLLIG